ncbi:YchJ family metal-binding protein [Microbacterium limosum]|uniref:YchJ family metal-binding protein n=1 Tax=Microbacterium limosum TaxID=3079935 RepID=A0AAU0MKI1_9MICO|nr:YchJ family metal-binding protein [Microbacterium sp. Y20]WOQ70498.1 YchJ family metal-binding protein [Microbacterium sp. Y20]
MSAPDPCPCGTASYEACCAPLHRGGAAPTAEALMRSRYGAFALGDADYLMSSWHPGTAPASVELDDRVRWTGLEIHDVRGGGPGESRGVVEFTAHYREAGRDRELRPGSPVAYRSSRGIR